MTLRGELSEGAIPGVLRHLYLQRSTGLLHFTRVATSHTVCFGKGRIVGAIANTPEADLGATLLRGGHISSDELARARAARARLGRPLSAVLIELGLAMRDTVEGAIASIVRSTLSEVFSWDQGTFDFEECPLARVLKADVALKLSTAELILESVRAVNDPVAIHAGLGNTERRLTASSTPVLSVPQSCLSPADAFVLSRVDGVLSAREIIEIAPLTAMEVERSLFGLLCVGLVEYQPLTAKQTRRSDAATGLRAAEHGEESRARGESSGAREAATQEAQDPGRATAETAPPEVAESYVLAVEQLLAEGKHAELIAMADQVLPHMPESAQIRLRILQARSHLVHPESLKLAIATLQDIVTTNPSEVGALFLLGQAYARAGLKRRAAATMQKVLEQDPEHREAAKELRRLEQEE
jgi:hypothetical protein